MENGKNSYGPLVTAKKKAGDALRESFGTCQVSTYDATQVALKAALASVNEERSTTTSRMALKVGLKLSGGGTAIMGGVKDGICAIRNRFYNVP